jgi:hypothetical protein
MANMGSALGAGQRLNRDDYLLTPDEDFQLILQGDGNLVLYACFGGPGDPNKAVLWASNTQGQDSQYAIMQTDGNFVIYGSHQPPNALWATNTNGSSDCALTITEADVPSGVTIQIIDESTGGTVLWQQQGPSGPPP